MSSDLHCTHTCAHAHSGIYTQGEGKLDGKLAGVQHEQTAVGHLWLPVITRLSLLWDTPPWTRRAWDRVAAVYRYDRNPLSSCCQRHLYPHFLDLRDRP